jgi:hypothetical protein
VVDRVTRSATEDARVEPDDLQVCKGILVKWRRSTGRRLSSDLVRIPSAIARLIGPELVGILDTPLVVLGGYGLLARRAPAPVFVSGRRAVCRPSAESDSRPLAGGRGRRRVGEPTSAGFGCDKGEALFAPASSRIPNLATVLFWRHGAVLRKGIVVLVPTRRAAELLVRGTFVRQDAFALRAAARRKLRHSQAPWLRKGLVRGSPGRCNFLGTRSFSSGSDIGHPGRRRPGRATAGRRRPAHQPGCAAARQSPWRTRTLRAPPADAPVRHSRIARRDAAPNRRRQPNAPACPVQPS